MRSEAYVIVSALVLAASGLAGCKSGGGAGRGAEVTDETKRANDAMWALAPKGADLGVVLAPRGVALADRAWTRLRDLSGKVAPLAEWNAVIERELMLPKGATLSDYGLTSEKAMALFRVQDELVVVLPVNDRAVFTAKLGGQRAGELDQIGPLRCKQVQAVYACATAEPLLAQLGGGDLGAAHAAVQARGELELAAHANPVGELALSLQLQAGAATLRGVVSSPAAEVTRLLGQEQRPELDDATSGFALYDLRPLLGELPDFPIVPGLSSKALVASVAGSLQLRGRPGAWRFDGALPLGDAGPFAQLVQRCTELSFVGKMLKNVDGACHVEIPGLTVGIGFDVWVEGKSLRFGQRGAASESAGKVARTPLGDELAGAPWIAAFWARGASLAAWPTRAEADEVQRAVQAKAVAVQHLLLLLVNELGMGVRQEGYQGKPALRFVAGVRTVFANPDDVVAKVLAIPTAEIGTPQGEAKAAQIAAASPASPFAHDLHAGITGLAFPVGILSAVVVPAFMDYTKKAKKSEAELQLARLSKATRIYYASNDALPSVPSPLTPAISCCQENFEGKRKCGPDARRWTTGAWKDLDFSIEEPHYFQYNYLTTGTSYVATAVGDLDCDGVTVTWVLRGEVRDGQLVEEVIPPPPNAD